MTRTAYDHDRDCGTTTKTVIVDWTDLKSIKVAERQKARLENDGYTLIGTKAPVGGNAAKLIYRKSANSRTTPLISTK